MAIRLYRLAANRLPEDQALLFDYARACRIHGYPEQAEESLRHLLRVDPNHIYVRYVLAGVLQDVGRHEDAISLLREVIDRQPNAELAHYSLGYSLSTLDRDEEAIPAFSEALRLAPHLVDASAALGVSYFRTQQFERAEPSLRRSVRLRGSAKDYEYLGWNLHHLDRVEEAEAVYRRALALDPRSRDVRVQLATILASLDRGEEALDILDGIRGGNDDAAVLGFRSTVLARLGRLQDAKHVALRALSLDDNVSDAYGALGMVHLEAGDQPEALQAYGRARTIEPERADFIAGRAAALSLGAFHSEAVAEFEAALRLESNLFLWEPRLKRYYEKSISALDRRFGPDSST